MCCCHSFEFCSLKSNHCRSKSVSYFQEHVILFHPLLQFPVCPFHLFGSSTELITKGKLATVKRLELSNLYSGQFELSNLYSGQFELSNLYSGQFTNLQFEHDRDIRLARTQTSAVSEHAHKTGHYPLWNEVKFIDRDPRWYTRRVKEAVHIRLHPDNINRDSGIEIPEAWMPTIKKHNRKNGTTTDH